MKKISYLLSLAAIAALSATFTACSSDDEAANSASQVPSKLRLTSSVALTRSTNTTLQGSQIYSGVKVGAFVNDGTSTTVSNNELTADGNGNFTGSDMYWPASGSASIYAYAPYNNAWTLSDDNSFSVQTDQSTDANYLASDLLYGVPSQNPYTKTGTGDESVNLTFSHKLAKLIITVKNGDNTDVASGTEVSITNTKIATTFNPSTGALGEATGSAADIKTATSTTAANDFASAAVIVPQEVASGTKLVKIVTGGKTYTAELAQAITFEGGKSYKFTVQIGEGSVQAKLTLSSASVTDWNDYDTEITSTATESVSYGVGDYLLADGTIVKANALTSEQQANVAAIIFSTNVSAIDAAEGYNAYAMGLKRYTNRKFIADADHPSQLYTATTVNTYAEALADLDGRTKTAAMLASDYYTARTDDEKASFIANLSGYTPALSGTTNSGWFLPSFGQLAEIMKTVVGLSLPATDSEDVTNGSNSAMYTATNGLTQDLITAFKTNYPLNQSNQFAIGNIVFATSTENGNTNTSHYGKIWHFSFTDAAEGQTDGSWSFGKNIGRGNNGRSVIPVTAVKLPTE